MRGGREEQYGIVPGEDPADRPRVVDEADEVLNSYTNWKPSGKSNVSCPTRSGAEMRSLVMAAGLVLFLLQGTAPPVSAQEVDLNALSWMQGCWVAGGRDATAEETWMAPRGGLMVAMARSVRGGRATGFEFVTLREVDGRLVYTARPSGQAPADFTAAVATGTLLRVENAEHDFPQKIEYHRVSPDSVTAKVFGAVGDDTPAFELRYGRSPC